MCEEKKKEPFPLWEWIQEDSKEEVQLKCGRILPDRGKSEPWPNMRKCNFYGRGNTTIPFEYRVFVARNRVMKTKR